MADSVIIAYPTSGLTAYFRVLNGSGNFYNGSTFEAYNASNIATYTVAMTEKGVTGVYVGTFPVIAAGIYSIVAFERIGGAAAATDTPIGHADVVWTGTTVLDLTGLSAHGDATWTPPTKDEIAAVILATPNQKLVTNADGQVEISNTDDVSMSVWAADEKLLTGYGTLVNDIAEKVWTYVSGAGRTLTSWGTLVASIVSGVWAAASKVVTSVTNAVTATGVPDIKLVTDKIATTLEVDGDDYKFTTASLAQAPSGGDATASNQTDILAAIAALNDASAADVATALLATTLDGTKTVGTALKDILSVAVGKVVKTDNDPVTLEFYAQNGSTVLATLVVPTDGSGRTAT